MNQDTDIDKISARLEYLEKNRRYIQNALEMALSLGDFQEEINKHYSPFQIFQETEKRISRLIQFEARALYFVNQTNSDLLLSVCEPDDVKQSIENEIEFLIDKGFIAWAIRERRGVSVLSKDQSRNIFLHVIATHSRIKGMFVGLFADQTQKIPDVSLDLLSNILRNTANALESIEYHSLLQNQKRILENKVDEKTKELIRYERQLQQAQKLEATGTLAEGIAHDFNNLLSIIMGYVSLAEDDIKPETVVSEYLQEAGKASLRAQELTKQLITFSKGGAPVKKIGSIEGLVKETINFVLSGSKIKCEYFLPHALWLVEFDEGQMKHAVKNLAFNAVESMPDSGNIDIKIENLQISSQTAKQSLPLSEGKYVKISIRDQGVGIPEEHLSKVFEPYFSTKEKGIQKGMGMGLATTYSIVNRHGGYITVESEMGIGTAFTLYLPALEKKTVELEPVRKAEPEKPASFTGRILVMDDEEMIRNISHQLLSRLGYEPESTQDGAEAIELYKNAMDSGRPFDAVILDLTVKVGMGGKKTVKKLLEIDPQVRAIVSSGYLNDPVMHDFRKYGFTGALTKPYTIEDLSNALNKVAIAKS